MPSRFSAEKPLNVNVTLYVPGTNSTILYSPVASVTALRTFSINAGLLASTVTPGSTAPVASLTVPEIAPVPCADANDGRHRNQANATANRSDRPPMDLSPSCMTDGISSAGRTETQDTPSKAN